MRTISIVSRSVPDLLVISIVPYIKLLVLLLLAF